MAYEVEMKAWVHDWPAVERHLRRTCTLVRSFHKQDRYFRRAPDDGSDETLFRVRLDDRLSCVTFKDKEVRSDFEVNVEREFTVDDADGFVELMRRAGCEEAYAKSKEGLQFTSDGLPAELVHVRGLGDFLEVEFVHSEDDATVHDRAVARIRVFIEEAGIESARVESRPYMKLLREETCD